MVNGDFESKDKEVHPILYSVIIHFGSHILEGGIDLKLSSIKTEMKEQGKRDFCLATQEIRMRLRFSY